MAVILNIETATDVCSVALGKDGEILSLKENKEGMSHASLLTVFIEDIFNENGMSALNLDAVSVSKGPGSYTGLRIGVSTAKGICYAQNIPLIAVNSLQAMALGLLKDKKIKNLPFDVKKAWYCSMIDARRMEVYAAFYSYSNKCVREVSADIIEEKSYAEFLNKRAIVFYGNGAQKCKSILKHQNAYFIDNITQSAQNMISISEKSFKKKNFEDVAYFEPFYLKDFIATTPKNII